MQNSYQKRTWLWITGVILLIVIAITSSFREKDPRPFRAPSATADNDTTPKKSRTGSSVARDGNRDMSTEEMEQTIRELEKKVAELQIQLYKRNGYRDYDRVMEKSRRMYEDGDLQRKIADEDLFRLKEELQRSFDHMDLPRRKMEIDEDETRDRWEKVQGEVERSMRRNQMDMELFDNAEMKRQMEMAKMRMKINSDVMRINKKQMEKQMQMAHVQMEKANVELKKFKKFLEDLRKDGLVQKGKPYEVEIKEGNLYINGKKVDQKLNDKYKNNPDYKSYFEKDNHFKFTSDGNDEHKNFLGEEVV